MSTHQVIAKIRNIYYKPTLKSEFDTYDISDLGEALNNANFFLQVDSDNKYAVSQWVTPKRTRSYPYARVYNTLGYSGKSITIIPIIKDEGSQGDRDYLQWDTVSLMSLLDTHVILGYYMSAERNSRNPEKPNKITNQKFDVDYLHSQFNAIGNYHASPLHWNLDQLKKVGGIGNAAITAYARISKSLGVTMHGSDSAISRINELSASAASFIETSRNLAEAAANRETVTVNPSENVRGEKASVTISNYLGGKYYFTADEIYIDQAKKTIRLVEAKHTNKTGKYLPSENDIKDAFIKMALFTNLEDVFLDGEPVKHEAFIKLTAPEEFDENNLSARKKVLYKKILDEAKANNFGITHE
jgi:hypothetical protein